MRMPPQGASSETLRKASVYTTVRLKAEPETADLAVGLESAQTSLRTAVEVRVAASERSIETAALRETADARLDRALVSASMATLIECENNRGDVRYRRVFGRGPSELTTLPLADEIAETQKLESRMADEPDGTAAKSHLEPVRRMREAAAAALATHVEAVQAESTARGREVVAREEWRRVYRKVYGELIARFPDDHRFVESFFRGFETGRPEPVEAEAPAEPGEPG